MKPPIQDDFSSPRRLSGLRLRSHSDGARYVHILWIVRKKRVVYMPRIIRSVFSQERHYNQIINNMWLTISERLYQHEIED